jgi:hypothetical protein
MERKTMDGVSRAVGSAVPIEINGRMLKLHPITVDDLGVVEQHILKKRGSHVQEAVKNCEGVPPEIQRMMLSEALQLDSRLKNHITSEESQLFIDSREGVKFTIWLMLNKQGQNVPFEEVSDWINNLENDALQSVMQVRDQVSAIDELGNETGPPTTSSQSAGPTTESQNPNKTESGEPGEAKASEKSTGDTQ